MIKDALQYLVGLKPVQTLELGSRTYTDATVVPVLEPLAKTVELETLTGVRDYLADNLDAVSLDQVMLHVADYRTVRVISGLCGDFRQRECLVQASAHDCGFSFGRYIEREEFQIGLMASFAPTPMREQVLRYVTGIVRSAEVKTADDGISQRVTARTGIARIAEVDLPNPVTLTPYRTFPEAEQPESAFVFRVKTVGEDIGVSLIEADGGRWKLQAAINIKAWLALNIPGARVII